MKPTISLCAVCAVFALCVGVAYAEVPRLVPDGKFVVTGTGKPFGVAVDQSTGDVFTAGFLNVTPFEFGRVAKFSASGGLLSPPSPFGEAIYYGAAVDPTNEDVYVANAEFSEIDTFDRNSGAPVSSFPVPAFVPSLTEPALEEDAAQLATDSAGDVYVPNALGNEVLEYGAAPVCSGEPLVCVPLHTFTGSGEHALKEPTGVAVDAAGDVWVADDANNRIEEFSPAGAFLGEFKSQGVRALALYEHEGAMDVLAVVINDATSCGVYSPPCAHLVEYSSTGVQLDDVGAGDFGSNEASVSQLFSMVAVDEASGQVYVTDGEKGLVWVFRPPAAPVLGRESAVEVGASDATLGALVNPGGVATSYRFEYDTRPYAEGEGPHGVSVPSPEGSVGVGFSSRAVSASARDLAPGTTYHYRAIVTNGLGTVAGPDQTFTTETAAQAACPDEQFRHAFSAALPDCRAYELVTPVGKTSFQPDTGSLWPEPFLPGGGFAGNVAARDGNRMSYLSTEVAPGSQTSGEEYVATREAGGWSSEDVIPLKRYTGDRCPVVNEYAIGVVSYSADLSQAILMNNSGNTAECNGEVEVLSGEPSGAADLLVRDNTTGGYQLVDLTPAGVVPTNAQFVASSANESRVIFEEFARLTPEALSDTMNTYEWSNGAVHLAFVLPSGAPAVGGVLAGISDDASEVFFTAGGELYMRMDGEHTVQLDVARGGPGPGGGGSFAGVSEDGSQVFFTANASAGLTSTTAPGSGNNLYRYEVGTGQLTDLADEVEGLTGISEDGSYVYFSSKGVLSGSQANQLGETAQSGQPNLYLDHEGAIAFIMHRAAGIRISPNGEFLAFNSTSSLTGYDNTDANTGSPDPEIYLYSAASNRFACASCDPSGEAPTAGGAFLGGGNALKERHVNPSYVSEVPHYVSDNGQVFFQTDEASLPSDTNGQQDVYEYDEDSGLHLISSGTSSSPATLLDASASGDDVFFLGRQALAPQDPGGEALRIYDARVDGGFPETAVPTACTTADACRAAATPQPSIFGEPASQTFTGAGNLTPPPPTISTPVKPKPKPKKCRKGYAKKKGRCVKIRKSKRASKTSHKARR